jgi:hypothetical protein
MGAIDKRYYADLQRISDQRAENLANAWEVIRELRKQIANMEKELMKAQPNLTASVYGYCPVCLSRGISRERRPDGDDRCEMGHYYPSRAAIRLKL